MKAVARWKSLGWRHPVWDLLRFYLSLRGVNKSNEWLTDLRKDKVLSVDDGTTSFPVDPTHIKRFVEYLDHRDKVYKGATDLLRSEEEALAYCKAKVIEVTKTTTKSLEHHQSSKAMVATVSTIGEKVCQQFGYDIEPNPRTRCVWCFGKGLHVTARNVDGAIPSLANPIIIWEIKEYWGKTAGGSKMSDAVYECNLVGRELREFEERTGFPVVHVVFVDGKEQWSYRKSDLYQFIDLLNQGIIDQLFIGKEVETHWEPALSEMLANAKTAKQ